MSVARLFQDGTVRELGEGEVLHHAGSEPEAVYLVTGARLSLHRDAIGQGGGIADKTAGTLVGETAALDEGRRAMTARAKEPVSLLEFPAAEFRGRLRRDLEACYEVVVPIARLLQAADIASRPASR